MLRRRCASPSSTNENLLDGVMLVIQVLGVARVALRSILVEDEQGAAVAALVAAPQAGERESFQLGAPARMRLGDDSPAWPRQTTGVRSRHRAGGQTPLLRARTP